MICDSLQLGPQCIAYGLVQDKTTWETGLSLFGMGTEPRPGVGGAYGKISQWCEGTRILGL